jgi:hypothetical protein
MPGDEETPFANQAASELPPQKSTLLTFVFACAAVPLILLVSDGYVRYRREPLLRPSLRLRYCFFDLSRNRGHEYFFEGPADEVTNALAKVHDHKIIARSSAFQFKGMKTCERLGGRWELPIFWTAAQIETHEYCRSSPRLQLRLFQEARLKTPGFFELSNGNFGALLCDGVDYPEALDTARWGNIS